MVLRRLFLALLAGVESLAPCYMAAQVDLSAGLHPLGPGRGAPSAFTMSLGVEHKASSFRNSEFLLLPLFYPIYEYEPAQVTVLRESLPETRVQEPSLAEEPRPSPLLIERQGNRFVRMTDSEYNNPNRSRLPSEKNEYQLKPRQEKAHTAAAWRPTMLVFRDGHQEQTSNYTIVGGTLYKYSDYWIDDSSTEKISLAELDIEATLRANQARGVNFVLPRAANEVVTRP